MGKDAVSGLFIPATREYVAGLVRGRDGETKLGERIEILEEGEALASSTARYVLLGIPEDIGVRANLGVGGAHTLWEPALGAFLNMQSTPHCSGSELLLLGAFNFDHWMKAVKAMDARRMRAIVDNIDEAVYPVIEQIVAAGKIPLVVGGGHNNAYPLLQGSSYALYSAVNCINLDAHSDYRQIEGRHSGNPFRYAKRDGFLNRYAMVGLHRPYNSAAVVQDLLRDESFSCSFYEDIFFNGEASFAEAIERAVAHTRGTPTGIELDLDCIAGVLSSAATPCGITALQARQYLRKCIGSARVAYVHLTEGAVTLRDGRTDKSTAKLVAYLLHDIISAGERSPG